MSSISAVKHPNSSRLSIKEKENTFTQPMSSASKIKSYFSSSKIPSKKNSLSNEQVIELGSTHELKSLPCDHHFIRVDLSQSNNNVIVIHDEPSPRTNMNDDGTHGSSQSSYDNNKPLHPLFLKSQKNTDATKCHHQRPAVYNELETHVSSMKKVKLTTASLSITETTSESKIVTNVETADIIPVIITLENEQEQDLPSIENANKNADHVLASDTELPLSNTSLNEQTSVLPLQNIHAISQVNTKSTFVLSNDEPQLNNNSQSPPLTAAAESGQGRPRRQAVLNTIARGATSSTFARHHVSSSEEISQLQQSIGRRTKPLDTDPVTDNFPTINTAPTTSTLALKVNEAKETCEVISDDDFNDGDDYKEEHGNKKRLLKNRLPAPNGPSSARASKSTSTNLFFLSKAEKQRKQSAEQERMRQEKLADMDAKIREQIKTDRERKEADRQVFGSSVNPFFTQTFVRAVSSLAPDGADETELSASAAICTAAGLLTSAGAAINLSHESHVVFPSVHHVGSRFSSRPTQSSGLSNEERSKLMLTSETVAMITSRLSANEQLQSQFGSFVTAIGSATAIIDMTGDDEYVLPAQLWLQRKDTSDTCAGYIDIDDMDGRFELEKWSTSFIDDYDALLVKLMSHCLSLARRSGHGIADDDATSIAVKYGTMGPSVAFGLGDQQHLLRHTTVDDVSQSQRASVAALSNWMNLWKEKRSADTCRKNAKTKQKSKTSARKRSACYDDYDSCDESADESDGLTNVCIVEGPVGAGKTAIVCACARSVSFNVVEMNSSQDRTAADVRKLVLEASQSRGIQGGGCSGGGGSQSQSVSQSQSQSTPFERNQSSSGSKISHLNLILFDEADTVLDTGDADNGMLSAIKEVARQAKCPIVLTCESRDHFPASLIDTLNPFLLQLERPSLPDCAAVIGQTIASHFAHHFSSDSSQAVVEIDTDNSDTTGKLLTNKTLYEAILLTCRSSHVSSESLSSELSNAVFKATWLNYLSLARMLHGDIRRCLNHLQVCLPMWTQRIALHANTQLLETSAEPVENAVISVFNTDTRVIVDDFPSHSPALYSPLTAPAVLSVAPRKGLVGGGQVLTIRGANFFQRCFASSSEKECCDDQLCASIGSDQDINTIAHACGFLSIEVLIDDYVCSAADYVVMSATEIALRLPDCAVTRQQGTHQITIVLHSPGIDSRSDTGQVLRRTTQLRSDAAGTSNSWFVLSKPAAFPALVSNRTKSSGKRNVARFQGRGCLSSLKSRSAISAKTCVNDADEDDYDDDDDDLSFSQDRGVDEGQLMLAATAVAATSALLLKNVRKRRVIDDDDDTEDDDADEVKLVAATPCDDISAEETTCAPAVVSGGEQERDCSVAPESSSAGEISSSTFELIVEPLPSPSQAAQQLLAHQLQQTPLVLKGRMISSRVIDMQAAFKSPLNWRHHCSSLSESENESKFSSSQESDPCPQNDFILIPSNIRTDRNVSVDEKEYWERERGVLDALNDLCCLRDCQSLGDLLVTSSRVHIAASCPPGSSRQQQYPYQLCLDASGEECERVTESDSALRGVAVAHDASCTLARIANQIMSKRAQSYLHAADTHKQTNTAASGNLNSKRSRALQYTICVDQLNSIESNFQAKDKYFHHQSLVTAAAAAAAAATTTSSRSAGDESATADIQSNSLRQTQSQSQQSRSQKSLSQTSMASCSKAATKTLMRSSNRSRNIDTDDRGLLMDVRKTKRSKLMGMCASWIDSDSDRDSSDIEGGSEGEDKIGGNGLGFRASQCTRKKRGSAKATICDDDDDEKLCESNTAVHTATISHTATDFHSVQLNALSAPLFSTDSFLSRWRNEEFVRYFERSVCLELDNEASCSSEDAWRVRRPVKAAAAASSRNSEELDSYLLVHQRIPRVAALCYLPMMGRMTQAESEYDACRSLGLTVSLTEVLNQRRSSRRTRNSGECDDFEKYEHMTASTGMTEDDVDKLLDFGFIGSHVRTNIKTNSSLTNGMRWT